MNGKELIKYIQKNHLEDAPVAVTATIYRPGDHDCITTTDVTIGQTSVYDEDKKKYIQAVDIYVDNNLY